MTEKVQCGTAVGGAPRQHGGNVTQAARDLGRPVADLVDFSASINPLGMPPQAHAAAVEAVGAAAHYPDVDAAELREKLARHHGLPAGQVLPGAGATEWIYLLPRALGCRRALLVLPAFGEYSRSLHQAGVAWDDFALDPRDGFAFDPERLLAALDEDSDLVVLANPANPTGAGIDPAPLERLALALRGRARLVVDEAFVDFCPQRSVLDRVTAHDNLYVLRSLTKFYAIPGLRAGFLAGPAAGMARLAAWREPWRLATPAIAAAGACLEAADYRRRTLELVPRLRNELTTGLERLGLTVFAGAANFLLVRLEGPADAAETLAAALRTRGILIRTCGDFPPLDGRYLRLAVRTRQENDRLLGALAELIGGGRSFR